MVSLGLCSLLHFPPRPPPPAASSLPQYAFNLFSHTTKIGENGYNEEEMKMVYETRKIWNVRLFGQLDVAHSQHSHKKSGRGRSILWEHKMTTNHHRPVLIRLRPLRTPIHAPL